MEDPMNSVDYWQNVYDTETYMACELRKGTLHVVNSDGGDGLPAMILAHETLAKKALEQLRKLRYAALNNDTDNNSGAKISMQA